MKTIRISSITITGALASAAMFAQAPRVEFEVASIRPSGPIQSAADVAKIGVHIDGARVNLNGLSLNDLLGAAYKLKLHQIAGPEWMASERFDINGKLPAGSNGDQIQPDRIPPDRIPPDRIQPDRIQPDRIQPDRIPLMIQALLTDRFGM